jgi:hypothetical protein
MKTGQMESRTKMIALEEALLKMPQMQIPVGNTFCGGMYARTAFIPKGTTMTGAIHKQDNLNIMVSGEITVVTEEGENRFTGFNMIVSKVGTKRAAYAHEDTIWITILKTEETDVENIERTLVTNDYAGLPELEGN